MSRNIHKIFKSCNVGSKSIPWNWCCDCPKCLFVYIILSPFLTKEERIKGCKNLFKYLNYFKKYKWLCLGFWSMLIVCGIIGFFVPVVLGNIISEIANANFDKALDNAWLLFAIELVNLFFSVMQTPFFKMLENKVKLDVKIDVVSSSFNINIGQYEKLGNGVFITRLTSDLNSLSNSFKMISETIMYIIVYIGCYYWIKHFPKYIFV